MILLWFFSDNSVWLIVSPRHGSKPWWLGVRGLGKGVFDQLMSGVGQSNQLGPIYQLGQNDQFLLAKLYNKDRFYQIGWLERF